MEPISKETFEKEAQKLKFPLRRKDATREQLDRYAELARAVSAYYAAIQNKRIGRISCIFEIAAGYGRGG